MNTFKAFRIHDADGKILGRFEDLALEQISPGEVVIDVQYSDINYKDALAATGAGRILRRYPLVGGIDLAGVPIVVTGATGGVGSIAIDMLSARGYEVIAVSGKPQASDYLKSLGAGTVVARDQLGLGSRPLEATRFGGAIDSVGGEMLAGLTRHVDFWGNIASVGLAGGAELKTTVMPFILRGVSLLGINSSATQRAERLEVWQRIAGDLAPRHLDRIVTRTIAFDELPGAFQAYMDGKVTGRTVVKIGAQP